MARERAIQIRVSHEEYAEIKKRAESRGRGISEYVRNKALGVDPGNAAKAVLADEVKGILTEPTGDETVPGAQEERVKALTTKLSARMSTRKARLEAERQLGLR